MTASLPASLALTVDGKPVIVTIPARMNLSGREGVINPIDLPVGEDVKVTPKEWRLLDALAWNEYNAYSPGYAAITADLACWSWSVCDSAGLGRGGGGVVASLVKKGLLLQEGLGQDAALGFTALGWVTWLKGRNLRVAKGEAVRNLC